MRKNLFVALCTRLTLTLLFFTTFFGCQHDPMELKPKQELPASVKEKIKFLGLDGLPIEERGDYYVIDGDISVSKKSLESIDTKDIKNGRSKQASYTLIDFANQPNITVRVDNSIPTSGDDDWWGTVQQAAIQWNGITGSRINFIYTTDPTADITVRTDTDPAFGLPLKDNTIAEGSWPSGGQAGFQVRVNLDFNSNASVSIPQKVYNMIHELGHNIGFRHTNWQGLSEFAGNGIPGTPNIGSNPDPNSVMNGGTANNSWVGFSQFDVIALRTLYPGITVTLGGPGCVPQNGGAASWTGQGHGGVGNYNYSWKYIITRGVQKITGTATGQTLTLNFHSGDGLLYALVTVEDSGESIGLSTGKLSSCTELP
jgi:hypothetical protein